MNRMHIAYYPGCSLHAMAREYNASTRLVCRKMGLELHEIPDWNCCGATSAHSLDHSLSIGLSCRNLALVSDMRLSQVATPCSGCFNRLKTASHEIRQNDSVRVQMEKLSGLALDGAREVEALHILQLIMEAAGTGGIRELVVKPLNGLKVAAYSGCLISRPQRIVQFDDPEQPVALDKLLEALGARPVQWSHKAECCGGGFAASDTGIVVDLGGQVLEAARQAGAEVIVAACPMCQANLDTRQRTIEEARGITYNLPIVYFTQLMGLAFGYSARQTGLNKLLTNPKTALSSRGLA